MGSDVPWSWRSSLDWRGLRSIGVLIMWVLWRLDFDYVGTKIMGLLVYDLMAFSMDMWRGGGD